MTHGAASVCTLLRKRQLSQCGSFTFERRVSKFLEGDKELLMEPELISPHENPILSLSVDRGRFVLAGSADATVSIFDLSRWGSEGFSRKLSHPSSFSRFRPVARSTKVPFGMVPEERSALEIPSGHSASVTHVQWYPGDTGAFISVASDGCMLLWDTNQMQPVLRVTPFAESLEEETAATWGCAHWQPSGEHSLIAAGSWFDSAVKLVDLRSGASSHQLVGHKRGVTSVQWSTTNPAVVASGSKDGTIRLWDIRKSGSNSCITVLGKDWTSGHQISHPPYHSDYSHLRRYALAMHRQQKQNKKRKFGSLPAAPNNYDSVQRQSVKSHSSHVARIAFLPGGQSLASVGGEGDLLLWDLRQGPTLMERKFVSRGGRPAATPLQRQAALCVDADSDTIWVGNKTSLMAFDIEGGSPKQILQGHLNNITSLDCILPERNLISGSKDGMILSWGKPKGALFASRKPLVIEDKDTW